MSVGVRCFQCKLELKGSGTGIQHATFTGHTWQPGYYCTGCEAMFSKHIECEQHIQQVGSNCRRAPTTSHTASTHMHRSSSLGGSTRPPLMPGGRVPPIGIAAPRLDATRSSVSATPSTNQYGSSPLPQCMMCQPPAIFLSKEALEIHCKGKSACAKCHIHFPSRENLLDHYRTSPLRVHPKCSDCGTGFVGDAARESHKVRCPRAVPAIVELMRSDSAPRLGLDGGSVTTASSPPGGESSRDESGRNVGSQGNIGGAVTLGPSGSDSDVSSLALSPTVTAVRPDETEIDVQGGTCHTHEPPITSSQNQGSDVSVPHVDIALPKVEERSATRIQGEGTVLPSDSYEAPTPTTTAMALEQEDAQGPRADPLSFHCRSCFADPCVKPVATLCGHIFCRSCIVRAFATKMCCPVCQRPSLIPLHAGVHS